MPEIYRSAPLTTQEESGVLVIHCSDPRYQPHFQDFIRKGLGLERYALLAVPGGAHFLTLEDYLPKFSSVGWRWVKFMLDLNPPSRLILIAHDGCRWYLDSRFGHDPARRRDRQVADLQRVRARLTDRFDRPRVELYRARLRTTKRSSRPSEELSAHSVATCLIFFRHRIRSQQIGDFEGFCKLQPPDDRA